MRLRGEFVVEDVPGEPPAIVRLRRRRVRNAGTLDQPATKRRAQLLPERRLMIWDC